MTQKARYTCDTGFASTDQGESRCAQGSARAHLARGLTLVDINTGLYDFGARQYDARMGVWLSPDPAFDGLNLYGHVHKNPVNLIDPTRLRAENQSWTNHDNFVGSMNGEVAAPGGHIRGPGPGLNSSLPNGSADFGGRKRSQGRQSPRSVTPSL